MPAMTETFVETPFLTLFGREISTAIVAVMRKLLTIINTMLAKNQTWNPNHA